MASNESIVGLKEIDPELLDMEKESVYGGRENMFCMLRLANCQLSHIEHYRYLIVS